MEYLSDIFNIGLFQNTLRTATPVVLAAMGGLMTEHAGIMNIGMDGMILIGAFAAVAFSFTMSSAAMGVLAAVLCGILIGLFFALFVVKLKSDEFIIGMALNTFAGGLTVYLLRSIFGVQGTFSDGGIQPLPSVHLDFLDSIPVIGPLLNDNSIFIYITWLIVFLAWVFLYRTPYGFWMRAAGEHPQSLATAGIDPQKMKFTASILCGILCGFAGAHLSLGYPKVFLAALLFGFLDALGLRLQGAGIPSDLTSTIPYLATVLMLVYVVVTGNRKKKKRAARQVDMSVSLNKI